jgi:hypothetical protein
MQVMARRAGSLLTMRWPCRGLILATVTFTLVVMAPSVAHAGVGASAVPSFPAEATVGNTGLPGSIELRNTNTDVNATHTNTVCNFGDPSPCPAGSPGITLIPACGQLGPFSACIAPDPGVFAISTVATGQAGTACAGMIFDVIVADAATGAVRFTPRGGEHVTLDGAGTVCRIQFTFSVLKTPTIDQNAGVPGVQTVQVADNTQFSGFLTASARGSSIGTTVRKATPVIATVAPAASPLGGQLTDTASVSGLVSPVAGATVDFRLYGPDDAACAGAPIFESLGRPLAANGTATSEPFTPTAPGVYRWRAFYSGDANNNAVASACNDANENTAVIPPPTITVETNQKTGRCLTTKFTLRVNVEAQGLQRVRVTLDGKTIKRSRKASFKVKVRVPALRRGRHVLRVIAVGSGGRTVRTTSFKRCGPPGLPRFIG